MAQSTAEAAAPKPGHNGYDPEKLKGFFSEFETAQAEIDRIMADARKKAEPYRAQQKEIKNECKKQTDLPKGTFSHVIRERKLKAKLEAIDEDLNAEEVDDADKVRHALGMLADTPLGGAAVGKAEAKAAGAAGVRKGSFQDALNQQREKEAAEGVA